MWQTYDFLAAELIRDRHREAAAVALARSAALGDDSRGGGSRGSARTLRAGAPRRVLAAVLRRVEAGAGALAAAARSWAARVEGRVA